jgi:hypothetical protein
MCFSISMQLASCDVFVCCGTLSRLAGALCCVFVWGGAVTADVILTTPPPCSEPHLLRAASAETKFLVIEKYKNVPAVWGPGSM